MTTHFLTGFLRPRHEAVPAAILVGGLVAALIIYLAAGTATDRLGERPEDSKRYVRQMEVYGGKANVLASEIQGWFEGLWHGRRLAFTVFCLSVLVAAVAFVVLTPLPPRVEARRRGDDRDPGS